MIDFFILGVQKAATSSLSEVLNKSENIYLPNKEKNFFLTETYFQHGIDAFLKEISDVSENKKIGIKCPDYFSSQSAARRIFEHNKDSKLIVISRNPVDRFVSAAFWYMQIGLVPVMDINLVVLKANNPNRDFAFEQLISYGMYSEALNNYRQLFKKDNFLHIFQHELKEKPNAVIKSVSEFLDIPLNGDLPKTDQTIKKGSIYSPVRLKFLAFINRNFFYRFEYIEGTIYSHLRPLPIRFLYYVGKLIDRVFISRFATNDKPLLSENSKEKLAKIYNADYQKFVKSIS